MNRCQLYQPELGEQCQYQTNDFVLGGVVVGALLNANAKVQKLDVLF